MSISIYTYTNPYELDQEIFWNKISECPHFCVSQTMVNGMSTIYPSLRESGVLSTIRNLVNSLYEDWESVNKRVSQIVAVDNAISQLKYDDGLDVNIRKSLQYNTKPIANCTRLLSELGVASSELNTEGLTYEQKVFVELYKIIKNNSVDAFNFNKCLSNEEIDSAIVKAINQTESASQKEYEKIVIHGVHQFSPSMLCAIEEISKHKEVILLFNYQSQYSKIYDTWLHIYSLFDEDINMSYNTEFTPVQLMMDSYESNALADNIGRISDGKHIENRTAIKSTEIIEFENVTEFANYVALQFKMAKEKALKSKDDRPVISYMREQFYSASGKANDILRAYFPEQFGERHFLDYPIGHFFISAANMWDEDTHSVVVTNYSDIKECLSAGIISEDRCGILISTFNTVLPYIEKETTLDRIIIRLKNLLKYVDGSNPERKKVGYFNCKKEELSSLIDSLTELKKIIVTFFDDFGSSEDGFKEFYSRIRKFLSSHINNNEDIDDEMKDVIKRLLARLEQTDLPESGTFNCLKQTMNYYLSQDENLAKGAQWIVRGFEQIDGDILRSSMQDPNKTTYHFCCLSDLDICSRKDESLPWPLDTAFFEKAKAPIDWKYQIYLKSKMEYHNFNRYALLYGLQFNRVGCKLSYVKTDNNKENDLYYIFSLMNLRIKKYKSIDYSTYIPKMTYTGGQQKGADEIINNLTELDKLKYTICPYRFVLESLLQGDSVFRDKFLIHTYMKVLLTNKVRKELQNLAFNKNMLMKTIRDKYQAVDDVFKISDEFEKTQIMASVYTNVTKNYVTSSNRYKPLKQEDALRKEEFLYIRVDNIKENFPTVEHLREMLTASTPVKYKCGEHCKYCASKDVCLEHSYSLEEQTC